MRVNPTGYYVDVTLSKEAPMGLGFDAVALKDVSVAFGSMAR